MSGAVAATRARWILAFIFTLFLVLNVVMISMIVMSVIHHEPRFLPPHLGPDVAFGERLGLVIIACVVAYFLAQQLYRLLVREDVPPSESVSPSMGLLAYLVLIVATFGFLGLGSWIWLPVVFLLLFIWTVVGLWSLLGWLFMVCILLLAAVGGAVTYLMLK